MTSGRRTPDDCRLSGATKRKTCCRMNWTTKPRVSAKALPQLRAWGMLAPTTEHKAKLSICKKWCLVYALNGTTFGTLDVQHPSRLTGQRMRRGWHKRLGRFCYAIWDIRGRHKMFPRCNPFEAHPGNWNTQITGQQGVGLALRRFGAKGKKTYEQSLIHLRREMHMHLYTRKKVTVPHPLQPDFRTSRWGKQQSVTIG